MLVVTESMASNKSIANGLIQAYAGNDRAETLGMLQAAAQAARADERNVIMTKLSEYRTMVKASTPTAKLDQVKRQWTLKTIDALLSSL